MPFAAIKVNRSLADPTGEAKQRRKGTATLTRRLSQAQRRVIELLRAIPNRRSNIVDIRNRLLGNRTIYIYDITNFEAEQLANEIRAILDEELLQIVTPIQAETKPPVYYWDPIIEQPYRKGTLEEINVFNAIAGAAILGALLNPQTILSSIPYQERLAGVQQKNYQVIRSLSSTTSAQVIRQVTLGIEAGDSPAVIARAIQTRFNVAKSSAARIAATEVNKALNDAKLDFTTQMNTREDVKAGVLHISALLPTTRETHAARHGNVYTAEAQRKWWNTGANRINCHCTVQTVLLDKSNKLVDTRLQTRLKKQGKAFFKKE